MAESTMWWLLAGAAVAVELVSGTFYLLMLAIGLAAGALAAHGGVALPAQLAVAAIVGGGCVAGWYQVRQRRPAAPDDAGNPDIHLDVGESVEVDHWQGDNTASVRYRGANWTVIPLGGVPHGPGTYRVREVRGSRLVVEKI